MERLRFASLSGRGSVSLHARLIDLCEARDTDGAARVSFETWQTLAPLLDTQALDTQALDAKSLDIQSLDAKSLDHETGDQP